MDANQNNQYKEFNVADNDYRQSKAKQYAVIAGVLFVLLIGGLFLFAFLSNDENTSSNSNDQPEQELNDPYADISRIDAKQFYIDGTHTFAGEVVLPTPCDLLEVDARVAESDPEQITLDFTVINNAETCAQVVTTQRFKVSAEAGKDATVSALLQNRAVELNLTPAAPGETPEDFELFIKG